MNTSLPPSLPSTTTGDALGGGAPLAGIPPSAAPLPRVVTTGRKKPLHKPEICGLDEDTGEPVELLATGRCKGVRVSIIRHLKTEESAPSSSALVDALAFTVTPPDEYSYPWLLEQMGQFLEIGPLKMGRGLFGFRYSARFGDGAGIVAWGGKSQNGRVYLSLMGQGCSRISDWSGLSEWLEQHRAALKRVDVAYDDYEGKLLNIAWAVKQYEEGGFNAGGRKPRHRVAGDWLHDEASTHGRTLYIGSRESGKLCRIYEKGKQLGDPHQRWTRAEVEWRAQDRYIPYDVLTRPGQYLAGAYPCLAMLNEEQSIIKTIAKGAQIAFERAVENIKQQSGKGINLVLEVKGGDYAEVVKQLRRPGYPARVDPYSYQIKRHPSMLDEDMQEVQEGDA